MSAPATNEKPADSPSLRLQISDLLVLTLTVAFGMAWIGALGDGDPPTDASNWTARASAAALDAFNGMLIGVELFGFAVVVRELFRGRALRSLAPGHWWFLVSAPQYVFGSMQYLVAVWGMGQFTDMIRWRVVEGSLSALVYLAITAIWLWAAMRMKTGPWRAVFVFRGMEQFLWALFRLYRTARTAELPVPTIHAMHFFGLMGTLFLCVMAMLPVAMLVDRRRKIQRDWLHYIGVGVMAAESLNFFHAWGSYAMRWWSAVFGHVFG